MTNIVTIGGGTGSYTVLSGLKNLPDVSLSALVSMSDNGGSTGVLRDELGVLPPGDIRQCLVALSEHSEIVRSLINYRFSEGTLKGHSFGNIFLAALEKVTGDFVKGVEIASEILKVKGKVIPITKDKADLEGQVNITNTNIQELGFKKIFYKNNVQLNENAKLAIEQADYIIIGPGDYYVSIMPNLIVNGFKEAIMASKAKIILPINLTNKSGHTLHWKASNYLKDIESYLGKSVDIILINNEAPSREQIERYELQEGDGVLIQDDLDDDRVVRKVLISHLIPSISSVDTVRRSFIRHDSLKLADCVSSLIKEKNIKIIFDFDDVLFDNTKQLKTRMYSCLEKNGISKDVAEKYYKEVREAEFYLKDFISKLLIRHNISKVSQGDIYEEIMCKCKDFVNKDLLGIVNNLGKSNCYIVSNGEKDFQKDKINRSGIYSLFSEVNIVPKSKKDNIERICSENKDSRIIFIDDKPKFFNDLDMERCKNLKTILFDENGLEKLITEINKN
ncbi:MAG: hypothetical protein US26_C0013G0003 [Candidatus Nomurabacteria bacterium GW2011_GWE1_36_71]|nr:MAG: hypothetical protein US26_C0013G0003 [Candidatus Nomurabacteria bacterium GW2011_GWE1_36_71]